MHLVSFSAVTWNFPLVGRTRMLTAAWLRLGVPTTFVQAPFLRSALERLCPFFRTQAPVRILRPWPTYPRRLWTRLSHGRLQASLRRRADALRRELDALLPWDDAAAIVVSPVWAPWLARLPFRRVVYDCIDELSVHVPRPELLPLFQEWEAALVERAAGAVATAACLGEELRRRRPELPVALIRNGVEAEWFIEQARAAPRPSDLPDGRRPIVGFVGALYDWLDWELMARTVAALPDCDFVFVGPHHGRGEVSRLAGRPNVRLTGRRRYEQVPAYVRAFDVCWAPFRAGRVAAAANPVKLYEYLALGKPVVTTPVADLDSFEGCVEVAADAPTMAERLRAAAAEGPRRAAARVAFARRNTWEARAGALAEFVAGLPVVEPPPLGQPPSG